MFRPERARVLRRESELEGHTALGWASVRWSGPVLQGADEVLTAAEGGTAVMLVQGIDVRPDDVLRLSEGDWVVLVARYAGSAASPRLRGWQVTAERWLGG